MKRILSVVAATLLALSPLTPSTAVAQDASAKRATEWLDVPIGQSFIYRDTRPISRILISDNNVAEIKLLEEGQFQVRGKAVGSTDLWIWFRNDIANPVNYQLTVHQDLSDLIRRVDNMVDGPSPRIYPLVDHLVVEGPVPDLETLERITQAALAYDEEFVNLMTVAGDHQVQLEVIFAEVSRSGLRELGMNAMWGDSRLGFSMQGPASAGSAYAYHAATDLTDGIVQAASAGPFQLLGVVDDINLAAILSVLEEHSLSKLLARPTLVALSGQQAEFLAGGEVPIPVAQQGSRISIDFKEYGVKLVFVPTVLGGEVVDMRVYVEVSEVDSATSIRLTGIEIPGFSSRKSSSHLRVEDGMTFAMAGMLSEQVRYTKSQIPLLGDIPIVGTLFRYTQHQREETELMIFVTPRLVRPMAAGEVPLPPGWTEDNNPNDFELYLLGMDKRAGSQTADPTGEIGLSR